MKKDILLEDFIKTLPFGFKDTALLQKVFVHRSFLNEKESVRLAVCESYERLEFLGDAVLSSAISHMLYNRYPDMDEGGLTSLRARLVNKGTLAAIAKEMSLGGQILLGRGEKSSGGDANPTILAGTFEALIAAVYLEHGYGEVFLYIEKIFLPLMDESITEPVHFDSKPRLQELAQKVYKEAPVYRLVNEEGPPHKKIFVVDALINGNVMGTGAASSKKGAEQMAAEDALRRLSAAAAAGAGRAKAEPKE